MPPADSSDDDDDGYYGPSLPPASPPPVQRQDVIGPVLPPQWTGLREDQGEDEGDDLTIGPLPPGDTAHDPHRDHQPLVRKSQQDLPKREEWMTVVPAKVEKRLGFKSVTSFSQRPVGPAVPKKAAAAGNAEEQSDDHAAERKRAASLLDTHQNQLKKKKQETVAEKVERQPFDPEKDLQVRKLDQRHTRSIIDNSKFLNTRFSGGPGNFL